ncbi:hypothetical protein EGR_01794 [Echinococcus granulosus]|uniref:Uncharacterized protein n=1 Tax=Echinococcus granulosus TaxID=6210 RepID=W6UPZ1_ECHGR|nr:hypothetical protein EGR_01794 [Echinococcus granulosus]EUB63303.1 hypothetical protein EGR_01794 [Echinococcus granulosus]
MEPKNPFGVCDAAATFQPLLQTPQIQLFPKYCNICLDYILGFAKEKTIRVPPIDHCFHKCNDDGSSSLDSAASPFLTKVQGMEQSYVERLPQPLLSPSSFRFLILHGN